MNDSDFIDMLDFLINMSKNEQIYVIQFVELSINIIPNVSNNNREICNFIESICCYNLRERVRERGRKSANVTANKTLKYDLVREHFCPSHDDTTYYDTGVTIQYIEIYRNTERWCIVPQACVLYVYASDMYQEQMAEDRLKTLPSSCWGGLNTTLNK